jgi:undecaprenyl-diphosphatase
MEADPLVKRNRGLLWLLIAGTIPAALAGLLFQKQAETTLRTPYVIATMMIGIGLVIWLAERAGRRQKDLSHVSLVDSLTVGAAQALAVVPGVSRSGVTIAAGLFRNLDRATAARFSFLLSTPVIAGAAAKDLWDLLRHQGGIPPEMRSAFLIGIAVSAVVGGLTIKFFLAYLKQRGLTFFVLYRLVFGIMIIALAHFFRYSGG